MNSNRNLLDEKRLQSLIKKAVAEEFDVREKTKQQEEDREDKIEASKFKHFLLHSNWTHSTHIYIGFAH